ncbi:hypothetical protein W97_04638 [Coniosporium apollinis CBS 100218]|uniref:RBR-type E3 ubiquitin transferase n=1 Tax=Coniosporium apollinis (strain CBS 100218) TaxID=1168221 RepID=R7YU26_CONA1|nr:uncharacterized protein W97_04638 [Coniosporium apollinis CBS 100218]EON65400.1 hypothetical protein W97_04638 [Coniosporium apollinis CBS 100218]
MAAGSRDVHRHERRRRSSRRSSRPPDSEDVARNASRAVSGPATNSAPDLAEIRRAREAFYSRPVEERQSEDPGATRATFSRPKSTRTISRRSGREHRRKPHDDTKRRAKEQEREDSSVYVYSRPAADTSTGSIRQSDAQRPERAKSLSGTHRASSTKPVIRRSRTTARARSSTITATATKSNAGEPATAAKRSAPTSPVKERRKSTGLLGSLFGIKPLPPPAPPEKVECVVCLADDILSNRAARLSCGHRMCHACLKRQFTLSASDPQHMPPRCCTSKPIPLRHVDRLFDDKFKIMWNTKYEEYTTKNRIYCPTRGCGQWIDPSNIRMDTAAGRKCGKCSKCKTKVCVLCNGKWHTRKECPRDEETKKFVEIAKENGWRRCYNCKAMVELKEGCNHMTCRCTAQFCMLCGEVWKTCSCPWFNYTQLDEADRLYMNVPQEVRQVFRHFPPPPPPPPPGVIWGPPPAGPDNNPPPPRPQPNNEDEFARRRRQETADEALARRLQAAALADLGADLHGAAEPDPAAIDAEVYGLGNAGTHHMNETYQVTPGNDGRPALRRSRTTAERSRGWFGRRQAARQDSGTGESSRGSVDASAMAGLADDGGGTGAGRVGAWLQHVESGPAETAGRRRAS